MPAGRPIMTTKYDFSILRKLRKKLNLTLEDLAEASGLSYPAIASIETNKAFPSLKTIDAIAEVLEIPAGKLVSLAEHQTVQTCQTESVHAEVLKGAGINLEKINVARFGELKIFRAAAKSGETVNSMQLHENCDCHELCYCLDGSIEIRVKDKVYQMNTNDVILFDGCSDHEYTAIRETEYLVIHLPKDTAFIEALLKKKDA